MIVESLQRLQSFPVHYKFIYHPIITKHRFRTLYKISTKPPATISRQIPSTRVQYKFQPYF